ncbi:MAG: translocation/assembly module TamB domain-containing protein [Candidatus Omnitrophota bacterium]
MQENNLHKLFKYKDLCVLHKPFNINKGEIIFSRENSPSSVEIEAQTKVRRYKIFAKVNGVSNNYHLTLSAKPKLNHSEIMSLLIFGKNTSALSPRENEQLTRADIRNVLINDIFIGKAEAKLAKSVGLDDININLNEALNSAKNSSVEIGKYIVGEKVYGTYSIKAEGEKDALAQQAVGAEIELTDNIILKGKRHWRESWAQPDEDRLDVEFKWKF